MSIDRSTLVLGPGKIAFDGATLFSEADIIATITKEYFDVRADAHGTILRALTDVSIEISCTPVAWANHAKMNPFLAMPLGTGIFGAADKPLVITPVNGQPLTAAAAAVLAPPSLVCAADKSPLGAMKFGCILANNTAWSAAGARLSHGASATGVALTGLDRTKCGPCTWDPVYGATPLKTESGTVIDWNVQLDPQRTDSDGVVDYTFGGIEAVAKLTPVGLTAEDLVTLLDIQGGTLKRGAAAATADLVLTGGTGGRSVTLKGCTPRAGSERFGRAVKRLGEIELVTVRSDTAGVLDPIAVLA